ncbi:MAG: hypothetical protein K2X55_28165 [Burkholderiaceae bacterium]|nr:hypothetical protein [Burkholderiaceae bacterium]
MSKKYQIVVSDKVLVTVEGVLANEDGKAKPFKFSLVCKRLPAKQLRDAMTDLAVADISQFLAPLTTEWRDQKLVLEDDDTPAEFCEEAFEALMDIPGVAQLAFNAYVNESGAKAKN